MGTRTQFRFEGTPVLVYQHSDGYPSGVLPTLLPFVAEFMKYRGYDDCYMPARLLQRLTNDSDAALKQMRENMKGMFGNREVTPEFLSFGVDTEIHGDIEYLYTVRKNGTVEVSRPSGEDPDKFPILATIPLGTAVAAALKMCGEE